MIGRRGYELSSSQSRGVGAELVPNRGGHGCLQVTPTRMVNGDGESAGAYTLKATKHKVVSCKEKFGPSVLRKFVADR